MTSAVTAAPRPPRPWLAPLMGLSFVAIWCTGYPAAKIIVGHSSPFTALSLRFACAALIFGTLAVIGRVAWPGWKAATHSAVVGCLLGAYVGKFITRRAAYFLLCLGSLWARRATSPAVIPSACRLISRRKATSLGCPSAPAAASTPSASCSAKSGFRS